MAVVFPVPLVVPAVTETEPPTTTGHSVEVAVEVVVPLVVVFVAEVVVLVGVVVVVVGNSVGVGSRGVVVGDDVVGDVGGFEVVTVALVPAVVPVPPLVVVSSLGQVVEVVVSVVPGSVSLAPPSSPTHSESSVRTTSELSNAGAFMGANDHVTLHILTVTREWPR